MIQVVCSPELIQLEISKTNYHKTHEVVLFLSLFFPKCQECVPIAMTQAGVRSERAASGSQNKISTFLPDHRKMSEIAESLL